MRVLFGLLLRPLRKSIMDGLGVDRPSLTIAMQKAANDRGLFIFVDALHFFDAVDEGLQLAAAAGVTELAQGLGFDLADALAGDLEGLAYLFEGVFAAVFEAEAHLDDTLFARRQGPKHLGRVLLEVDRDDGVGGG